MINPSLFPPANDLPVDRLAAIFDNTTNSYKFYWFLAIMDCVKENRPPVIPVDHLVARMIAAAWYPIHYFRLSFGKQDQLGPLVLSIGSELRLPQDASQSEVAAAVRGYTRNSISSLARAVASLKTYVPYRFQRPFFDSQLRGTVDWKVNRLVREMAGRAFGDPTTPCLYRYVPVAEGEGIEIHPLWLAYLQTNLPIAMGYCLWNLVNYLQRNNPNVPNVAGKMFAPGQRDLGEGRRFWRTAIESMGDVRCIYSGETLRTDALSLDHFIPWSYVAHDLLWNIIPTSARVNSSKSNQLPNLSTYFDPFAQLQYDAVHAIATHKRGNILEDYILLCRKQSIDELLSMPAGEFKQVLRDTIAPQVQIAMNMGFAVDWRYMQ
jgi:5-methylcytosine-specific restriction endonuclease McrA